MAKAADFDLSMTQLLDTCILVDYLRDKAPAIEFLEGLDSAPAISVITVMELTAGIRGKEEERVLAQLFDELAIYDIDSPVAMDAGKYLKQYAASHAVEPPDALIAATVHCHALDLVTHNLKHFPMFKGLKRPYKL